jgi:hypothetical protein
VETDTFLPIELRGPELVSQRAVHGGDIREARVKRPIGAAYFGDPGGVFGVARMGRVCQGVHNLLVSGKSSGFFQQAAPGAVDQTYRWSRRFGEPRGNQLKPVKPAVTKVKH